MSVATMLTHAATVQRLTGGTRDASGGLERVWVDQFRDMPCRIEDASAAQKEMYAALNMEVSHTIYAEQDGIRNGDRINEGGVYYVVVGLRKFRTVGGVGAYYRIDANEVKPL